MKTLYNNLKNLIHNRYKSIIENLARYFNTNSITIRQNQITALFAGFGTNKPIGSFIRLVADLPDGRDAIPEQLSFHPTTGCCPVCGENLDESRENENNEQVICRDCLTPHHKACFEWNGKCAQYACGSKEHYKAEVLETTTMSETTPLAAETILSNI